MILAQEDGPSRPAGRAAAWAASAWTAEQTRRAMLIGFGAIGALMVALTLLGSSILSAAHSASDEAAYLQYAHNLLHGTYAVASQQREGLYLWHSPALPLLIAPLVWLKIPIQVIRLIGPICMIGSGLTLTAILRRFVRPQVAVAAGLLLCLYPPFWRLLPELFVEPLALLMCLLGFEALVRCYQRGRLRWGVAAGAAFGYMVLGREEYGYLMIGILVLAVLALAVRRRRSAIMPIAVASFAALVVCAPWLAYTYSKTHVPLYWSSASGESFYWMSSTSPGESGSWQSVDSVFSNPHLADHRVLFRRLVAMSQLQANRTLTRLAIDNIKRDPGNYIRHVVDNGERIFLGVPLSFQSDTVSNLAFYGAPNVALLLLVCAAVAILRRRRAGLPRLLIPIVVFGAIGLVWHLPAAAYPRMATLSIPAFIVVAAVGGEAALSSRPRRVPA